MRKSTFFRLSEAFQSCTIRTCEAPPRNFPRDSKVVKVHYDDYWYVSFSIPALYWTLFYCSTIFHTTIHCFIVKCLRASLLESCRVRSVCCILRRLGHQSSQHGAIRTTSEVDNVYTMLELRLIEQFIAILKLAT